MRAVLVFNPHSGRAWRANPEALCAALRAHGYETTYRPTECETDIDLALAEPLDLAVVAGGDGTIRAVATRLVGKRVPIAVLPTGTVNNISRALGIGGSPARIIAGLRHPVRRLFDVGRVDSPCGQDLFIETFGCGLYADALAAYQPEKGKSYLRSVGAAIRAMGGRHVPEYRVVLDGQDLSGAYRLVEALNIPSFGPRLTLSAHADPSDGLLDLVCVAAGASDSVLRYLTAALSGRFEALPQVVVRRGRRLELAGSTPFCYHVDAEVRPKPGGPNTPAHAGQTWTIRVEVLPHALEFWVPRAPRRGAADAPA